MDQPKSNVHALIERFSAFNQALITFVETCSTDDWTKVTTAEGWPVGITAHHVGAVHYPVLGWVQLMVEGKPTPTITMADVDQMNRDNITLYANCTSAEVIEFLRGEGDKALAYLQTISDADLERTAYLKIFDTTMSAGQLFQIVMIDEAEKHLVSLRETVAKTSMTATQIKAILQRLNDEIMNEGNLDLIAEIFDAKYASRSGPQLEEVAVGHDAVKAMHHFIHTTYADFHVSINALIAEGELAASNWSCVGIYQGEPSATVQPGQKVTWSGTSWFRVRDGKILERWAYSDELTPIEV